MSAPDAFVDVNEWVLSCFASAEALHRWRIWS